VDTTVEQLCRAFRLSRSATPVRAAAAALEDLGIEPVYRSTGGGSDANALIANGLPVLNVANGTERNHQPDESVTVEALETMLDLTLRIIERSAEV
jgi:tripeptide aminopeptidase